MFNTPLAQASFEQVVRFCETFPEGVRVEYKRELAGIPKVISSFANTAGGIWVIGVETDKTTNMPKMPITGMLGKQGIEEQIVQSAHTGIYPAITPDVRVFEVEGKPGQIIVVVKVPESIEAPHAIENSTKVYIRVASTTSPYDLADIDRIKYLIERRQGPETRREELINQAADRSPFRGHLPRVRVIFSPIYPHGVVIGRDMLYEAAQKLHQHGMEYVREFRRISEGILSSRRAGQHIHHHFEASIYGPIFFEEPFQQEGEIEVRRKQKRVPYVYPVRLLYPIAQVINHALPLFQHAVTNVLIRYELFGSAGLGLLPERPGRQVIDRELALESYECIDSHVVVSRHDIVESLPARRIDVVAEMFGQVLWAFNYTNPNLHADVGEWLRMNNLI